MYCEWSYQSYGQHVGYQVKPNVGMAGFEPAAPRSQSESSTKLSYIPVSGLRLCPRACPRPDLEGIPAPGCRATPILRYLPVGGVRWQMNSTSSLGWFG